MDAVNYRVPLRGRPCLQRGGVLLIIICMCAVPVILLACLGEAGADGKGKQAGAIRVGTWNLEWFGHPKKPRSTEDLVNIASALVAGGVDVLAFQEVAVTKFGQSGEPRSYALDELEGILAAEHGQPWNYWIHKGQGEQHLGFMWRTDRVDLEASAVFGLPSSNVENVLTNAKGKQQKVTKQPWPRLPVLAHVKTGDGTTDVSLVNLHLKAPEPEYGPTAFWETRRQACASLAAWIDGMWNPDPAPKGAGKPGAGAKTSKGGGIAKPILPPKLGFPLSKSASSVLGRLDPDLAVLGDFNTPEKIDEVADPLVDLGMHFLGSGESTYDKGGTLDRVLVSAPMGEEHALSAGAVPKKELFLVAPGGTKSAGVPDHYMVTFTFVVRPDDD